MRCKCNFFSVQQKFHVFIPKRDHFCSGISMRRVVDVDVVPPESVPISIAACGL